MNDWLLGVLVLASCVDATDPQLIAVGESTALATKAESAFLNGDYAGALVQFRRARALAPRDTNLGLWEASTLAESGDAVNAVIVLDALIAMHGDTVLPVAEQNRAAYLMRLGRTNQALVSLASAHRSGRINAQSVLADPDFTPLKEGGWLLFLDRL